MKANDLKSFQYDDPINISESFFREIRWWVLTSPSRGRRKKSKQPGIDTKSTEKCKNSYLLHSRWYFDHSPVSLLGLVHQVAHPEQKWPKTLHMNHKPLCFASIICSLPISWSQLYKECLEEKNISSSQLDKIAHKSSGIIITITITTRQNLAHTYIHTYVPHL